MRALGSLYGTPTYNVKTSDKGQSNLPMLQATGAQSGMRETRRVFRDSYSTQTSSVTHQTFNFAGEPAAADEKAEYSRDQSEAAEPEVDHPHMRTSMDSDRGMSFLGSPMGSVSNIEGISKSTSHSLPDPWHPASTSKHQEYLNLYRLQFGISLKAGSYYRYSIESQPHKLH